MFQDLQVPQILVIACYCNLQQFPNQMTRIFETGQPFLVVTTSYPSTSQLLAISCDAVHVPKMKSEYSANICTASISGVAGSKPFQVGELLGVILDPG